MFCAAREAYIRTVETRCPTPKREGTRVTLTHGAIVMKLFSRIFAARNSSNLTTALERQRLGKTMPGQTAAMAGARFGCLVAN